MAHFAGGDFPVNFGVYQVSASGTSATVTASSTAFTNQGPAINMLIGGSMTINSTGTGSVRIDYAYNDGTSNVTGTLVSSASANTAATAPSNGMAFIRLGSGQSLQMVTNYPNALGGAVTFTCRLSGIPLSVS